MNTLKDFTQLVNLCIEAAVEKYGPMGTVKISYKLRGRSAGEARCKISRLTREAFDLELRFNREAIEKHWDQMVKETIPHEVAHLVAYAHPELGASKHNARWAQIDRSLGGNGSRTHSMELTPGRRTTRHIYRMSNGEEIKIGPKYHNKLQSGQYGNLKDRNGNKIYAEGYIRSIRT